MGTFYAMKLTKAGISLRLSVNQIPLIISARPERMERADELNAWLLPGRNELHLLLDRPAEAGAAAQVELRLEPLQAGQSTSSARPLAEFRWPPANPDDEHYPFEISLPFSVDDPPPSDFWPQATVISWDVDAWRDVLGLLGQLHGAMERRDLTAATRLLIYKSRDVHKAHYMPAQEASSDLRDYLELFFNAPGWAIAPLEVEQLEPHLVASKRLVWVTGPDEQEPLRSSPGTSPGMVLPVYFAPVDGQWTIVR